MRCFMMVVNGFFTISQSLLSTLLEEIERNGTKRCAARRYERPLTIIGAAIG